ncbi:deoxyribose-phosphate aldolase [Nesterenkonia sp. HG001]|uniref:deoxyribose-phosphate aldolase n=1 Tax=Nesterenkonia sp. HG001 TaxID=2983207 RepID=UPI002AC58A4A|nr:deoxyribose-phosphate aldolase [Nesterenkonia sp. HG001]MDZ5078722.1 deoxyribose-phosphate aldolase [Nesterenkonia sp. HG001]
MSTTPDGAPAPAPREMAGLIDHTALKPDTDEATVRRVVSEAREHGFAAVCVNPRWVPLVVAELTGSTVKTCTVVGFPLGASTTASKVAETQEAVAAGAQEIDMVVDIADALAGDSAAVETQIRVLAEAAHTEGAILKVILETALLSEDAKELVCRASEAAGADFVKTSTGFAGGGATVEDIALMHRLVGGRLGIKASGGVRSYADAVAMVSAGATRIGASSSLDIVGADETTSAPGAADDY